MENFKKVLLYKLISALSFLKLIKNRSYETAVAAFLLVDKIIPIKFRSYKKHSLNGPIQCNQSNDY